MKSKVCLSFVLVGVLLSTGHAWAQGGSVYASFGFGGGIQWYDANGEAHDLSNKSSVLNIRFGGNYTVPSVLSDSLFMGGSLYMQQKAASYSNFLGSYTTGLNIQDIVLYGGLEGPIYSVKAGFLIDMLGDSSSLFITPNLPDLRTSDGQHALFADADVHIPISFLLIGGSVKYYLTFPRTVTLGPISVSEDDGDWLIAGLRLAGRASIGEVGLETDFILRTAGKKGSEDLYAGYLLTLIPYMRISPPSVPISFIFKLSTYDEYTDYGVTMSGKNMYNIRLGFTLGTTVRF